MSTCNFKFHKTQQFRNVVKSVKEQAQFKGLDEEGKAIFDSLAKPPTITYVGLTKLHGTNASIVLNEDGVISFHSKSQLLATLDKEIFSLNKDNADFAQSMCRNKEGVYKVMEEAKKMSRGLYGEVKYPIKISGEWCGQGIQKGVGISMIPKRTLFIFGIKVGETCQESKQGWLPVICTSQLHSPEHDIVSIFRTVGVVSEDIDFNQPEFSQNNLANHTKAVEDRCPVAAALGVEDTLVGEGLVWTPASAEYCWDSGSWFKTKGQKHSVSKVKTVASVCPEKLESIKEFIEYAVTQNRLEQGLGEVGLDQKKIGTFIGWINRDISNEESDVLAANGLFMKDVGKHIASKAREYYLCQLNADL